MLMPIFYRRNIHLKMKTTILFRISTDNVSSSVQFYGHDYTDYNMPIKLLFCSGEYLLIMCPVVYSLMAMIILTITCP